MTEQNEQEPVVEAVQEQETPIEELLFGKEEETNDVSDKSIDEMVTIAGGNEEGEFVEEQPAEEEQTTEPTEVEEAALNKAKFYQDSYQKHLAKLKQADIGLYNEIQGEVKAERNLTPEPDVSESYADDPYTQQIAKGFADLERKQSAQINAEKYSQEYHAASQALEGFVTENNISEDDLNMAFQAANAMGFDMQKAHKESQLGVPNRAVTYVMEKLQHKLITDYYSGKATAIENEAVEKVAAVNNVTQPTAGATPEPRKLTREDKLLKAMNEAGNKDAVSELFGT